MRVTPLGFNTSTFVLTSKVRHALGECVSGKTRAEFAKAKPAQAAPVDRKKLLRLIEKGSGKAAHGRTLSRSSEDTPAVVWLQAIPMHVFPASMEIGFLETFRRRVSRLRARWSRPSGLGRLGPHFPVYPGRANNIRPRESRVWFRLELPGEGRWQ